MPNNTPWTPGPWKVWAMQVCSAAPEHGGDEKQPDNSDVVATTYQRNENGQCITADAHLMAASPEMYDALALYVEHFGDPLKVARKALTKANNGKPIPSPALIHCTLHEAAEELYAALELCRMVLEHARLHPDLHDTIDNALAGQEARKALQKANPAKWGEQTDGK